MSQKEFQTLQKRFLKIFYLTGRKAFLSFLSKAYLPGKKRSLPLRFDKILIIAPPRIGDAALCLSVFTALRNAFPETRIHVAANKYVAELFSLVKEIDQIVPLAKTLKARLHTLRTVFRTPEYDIAADLNFDYPLYPAILAGLSARYSVGYEYAGRGFFLSKTLPDPELFQHASDIFFGPVLEVLPLAKRPKPQLHVPDELVSKTQKRLARVGIGKEDRVILIHPGAHHRTQRWLPEYFAEAAQRILDTDCGKVILLGGRIEKKLIEKICMTMSKVPQGTYTDLTIKESIGLIQRANLMICNNSGPLHIAAALSTPTISTMGPTVKARWEPLGTIHQVLRIDNLPCIGCNLGYCRIGTHDCMALITPPMLLKAVHDLLGNQDVEMTSGP